jgi:hypothetical protein
LWIDLETLAIAIMLDELADNGSTRQRPGEDCPAAVASVSSGFSTMPDPRWGPLGRQQRLYFNPLPHGHAALRETRSTSRNLRPRSDSTDHRGLPDSTDCPDRLNGYLAAMQLAL